MLDHGVVGAVLDVGPARNVSRENATGQRPIPSRKMQNLQTTTTTTTTTPTPTTTTTEQ